MPGEAPDNHLGKHAVFDPDQLLLDNECPGLRGKQLQRRAIANEDLGSRSQAAAYAGCPAKTCWARAVTRATRTALSASSEDSSCPEASRRFNVRRGAMSW